MKRIIATLSFLVIFSNTASAELLSSTGSSVDSCKGKQRCVAIYMAPWCSACRASIPLVNRMQEKLSGKDKVGMKVIIGRDRKDKIIDYGKSVGGEVYYDFADKFGYKHKIKSVPTWMLLDGEDRTLMQFSGSPSGASADTLADYMIESKFNLSNFLNSSISWKNLS